MRRLMVMAILATAGLLAASPATAVARAADVKAIAADPVDSGGCDPAGKWTFIITGVTGFAAPAAISASVVGAAPVTIPLAGVSPYGFASYQLTSSAVLTGEATAQIDTGWNSTTGNFFLSTGPCVGTSMKMSSASPMVVFGSAYSVAGRLTLASGAALANRRVHVRLHSIDARGKGLDVGEFTTDADGRFTVPLTAQSPGMITLTGEFFGESAAGGGEDVSFDSVSVWSLPAAPAAAVGQLASSAGATVAAGAKTVVSGSGFAPESEVAVAIYSSPQLLGVFTTDASGAFSAEVIIPATLTGDHKLVATGLDEEHEAYRYLATAVTVTASGQGGGLPVTGTSVTAFVAAGLLLVVSGFALTRWSRRRRPA